MSQVQPLLDIHSFAEDLVMKPCGTPGPGQADVSLSLQLQKKNEWDV